MFFDKHPVIIPSPKVIYSGDIPASVKLPADVKEAWDKSIELSKAYHAYREETAHLFEYSETPHTFTDSQHGQIMPDGTTKQGWSRTTTTGSWVFAADAEADKADTAMLAKAVAEGMDNLRLVGLGTPNRDKVQLDRSNAWRLLNARAEAAMVAELELVNKFRDCQDDLVEQAKAAMDKPLKAAEKAQETYTKAMAELRAAEGVADWARHVWLEHGDMLSYVEDFGVVEYKADDEICRVHV